jgi:hypothetical protein
MPRIRTLLAVTAVALSSAFVGMAASSTAVADSPPFTDPASTGKLTLCNTLGQPVTSGNIHIKPFAWTVVGTSQAPAGYQDFGKATLFAYQPIPNVSAVNWYGEQITGSSSYSNVKRPMTRATAADMALADYLDSYPAKWNGLVELRLLLSAVGQSTITGAYDTAILQVTGDTWTEVYGGTDGCDAGDAISSEMILPSVSAEGTPAPNATTDGPAAKATKGATTNGAAHSTPASPSPGVSDSNAASSSNANSGTQSPNGSAGGDSSTEGSSFAGSPSAVANERTTSSSGSAGWIVAAVIAVLIVGGGVFWWRRKTGARSS